MDTRLSIGDFSRMTHLSVKALRHYHDEGLLAPAEVNVQTGYRSYDPGQVAAAQVIRRLRNLGMPIEAVKAVLAARDVDERNVLIARHLERMENELARTRATVASLRALLDPQPAALPIEYRAIPEMLVAAVRKRIALPDIEPWWSQSFAALAHAVRTQGVGPAGPAGGVYPTELFTDERAEVILFVPIAAPLEATPEVRTLVLPQAEVAVALHAGPLREADRTYAPLGAHVMQCAIAVDGPIREHYLLGRADVTDEADLRTEICWPIFLTA